LAILAEYVNTRHNIGFKILDYFAKKRLFFPDSKISALAEYKFKGRTFFLEAQHLYEFKWKSGAILDGKENIRSKTY
jgi:peptidyl-tRNA hydrolase